MTLKTVRIDPLKPCTSYQAGHGTHVAGDPTGSSGLRCSSCSWPACCRSARFWWSTWWSSSHPAMAGKEITRRMLGSSAFGLTRSMAVWSTEEHRGSLSPSTRLLTEVQLLRAEMHFLSSHHWQPLVFAVQLVQSEKRWHLSSTVAKESDEMRQGQKKRRGITALQSERSQRTCI